MHLLGCLFLLHINGLEFRAIVPIVTICTSMRWFLSKQGPRPIPPTVWLLVGRIFVFLSPSLLLSFLLLPIFCEILETFLFLGL
ncbi:hypothetical protein F5883DRAFT_256424 [Diaporthe sp. PMI_573]|nr:hypothetical protein F5883DRAFT_256424 [Diaporthaceae sp. PMI_573]